MTKRLLQQTKGQFVTFCNLLPDAACRLAIELFKQGILTKDGVAKAVME